MAPNQESTKDWFSQDVQNTVEDSLRVGCDNISALGKSPGDWVEEPEESSPSTDNKVSFGNIRANGGCVLAAGPNEGPSHPEKSEHSEDEVSPLFVVSKIAIADYSRNVFTL